VATRRRLHVLCLVSILLPLASLSLFAQSQTSSSARRTVRRPALEPRPRTTAPRSSARTTPARPARTAVRPVARESAPAARPDADTERTSRAASARTRPATPAGERATPAGETLAVINGETISRPELDRYATEKWGRQILEDLIDFTLVRQEAKARGLDCTEPEIDQRISAVKQQLGGEAGYTQMLHDRGLSERMYRSETETDILLDKLMESEFHVTDADAKAYYQAHRSDFGSPAKVHLYSITTSSAQNAYAARQQIADGKPFGTVARDFSVDATGRTGGDLGWVTASDITQPLVSAVAFSLQKGQVSNPVKIGEEYHVLYAEDVQPGTAKPVEQATDEIRARLAKERAVPREVYLLSLRRKSNIEVTWQPQAYLTEEYAGLRTIRIIVDDKPLSLPIPPEKMAGRLMVAAKPVLQEIGAKLTWKAPLRTLVARTGAGTVALKVGSPLAMSGTKQTDMGIAPQMRNGTLWISPRVALEALGAKVTWDEYRNALLVTSPAALGPRKAGLG
jgi:parvulin-like peptidyl-prolyl isomerase